ncbi:hypothetical protein NLJ89_g10248 [Agrocybe chaxingu]|uniref:D-xylose 1-dehydrogenase (NADP(+), D-xylono-1,5-lactone-forming) n=1 Tax=Agrocybe chaxingu TaxID=84603 RepID=A0A9W8JRM6_9AGAR|nr:hypothetical protein NLJ89_g10248 [Agrocybe chaxingu]
MASLASLVKRIYLMSSPPIAIKATTPAKPLKFGILGAAAIAPSALITPSKSHPEVLIYAVAARSLERAQAFAKKHGIEKAYGRYQALLDDPEVDVVYNPLPNALHYEWTMKALAAGKHVLNEKLSADTAEETREMFEFAEKKGLVLLDAYHYRRVNFVIVGIYERRTPDFAGYAMDCIHYVSSSDPTEVIAATQEPFVPRNLPESFVKNVDRRTLATLALPRDATATLVCDLGEPPSLGVIPKLPQLTFRVECELGTLDFFNFILPTLYHSITIKIRGGHTRVEKVYRAADRKGDVGTEA